MFKLYFDGASKKNPGISGIGFFIENSKNEEIYFECKFLGENFTNNESEYHALYEGLLKCVELKIKKLKVYGDSNLIIKQMSGEYKINSSNLIPLNNKCNKLLENFNLIEFFHIYREENTRADFLANEAIRNEAISNENKITWENKIIEWLSKNYQTYPDYINKRFFYETSYIDKNLENNYEEVFIENDELNLLTQNYNEFTEYINKSENKFVTSFFNKDKTTKLIIPIPQKGKNFTTMKDFIDNSSKEHQIIFWKFVAREIIVMLDSHSKIWVNTHGLGVHYFHLRLDLFPKYYKTKKFKN